MFGGGGGVWGGGGGGKFYNIGGQGGPKSQQAHDVVLTSMQRNDVTSTYFDVMYPLVFNKSVPNNYISHPTI